MVKMDFVTRNPDLVAYMYNNKGTEQKARPLSLNSTFEVHALIQMGGGRGAGVQTQHLKNHKHIGFLSKTGLDPL